ncbi:MAG: CapA family protein [Clostridia bacterium]|nr:CapA family protein [Clostridia bacterium]
MKKITAIILCAIISLSLFSCKVIQSELSADGTLPDAETATAPVTDTPDTEPEPEPDTEVTISMVGDVLLHEKVSESGEMADGTYNYDHLFANVREEIEAADIAIVNQEVILGGRDMGISGYPSFNGAFEVGDAIAGAGFDIVLHATNHTIDRGSKAVRNCISFWETNHPEMAILGINSSPEEQSDIYVREENGIKIAFLNYTYGTNGIPLPTDMPYCVNLLDEATLKADISAAEAMADFTVVLPHWGTEYVLEADSNQRYWANIMFQCGADLVIGTHPHVIEPVEIMEDEDHSMLIYYSIGNFINSTAQTGAGIANRMVGGMANVTLDRDENGEVYIKDYGVTPLVTHVLTGSGRITTYKLSDYTEDLAAKNEIVASDPSFSLEYCRNLVKKVFGDLCE